MVEPPLIIRRQQLFNERFFQLRTSKIEKQQTY